MRLPHADRVQIPSGKLSGYCLDPNHSTGKHKARVFRAALGLTAADADWLRDQILAAVFEADAEETEPSAHGRRYVVHFPLMTDVGTAVVRTTWIVRNGEEIPRLTSCYIP